MKRRSHGEGSIRERGGDSYSLRYRVGGKRYEKAFHGSLAEARKELRRLLRSGDAGEHVAPNRMTVRAWSDSWLMLMGRETSKTPRRRSRGLVGARTLEGYRDLLERYILPVLGSRPVQQVTVGEIDRLYVNLEQRISATTVRHTHVCLRACLAAAVRKGVLQKNPSDNADVPASEDAEIGQALDQDELKRLLEGFRGSVLYPIIATAAFTGVRLGELLALRWSDLDVATATLKIERAIERTKEFGRRIKPPKTWRGKRTIEIDLALLAMLVAQRESYLRQVAGVADGTAVDLSLVKLPADALMFPSPVEPFSFTRLRNPNGVTRETRERFRKLGFAKLRFHDLRASHGTMLLDRGVPVHTVAARLGHDPAVLLRNYAKRTKKSDSAAAAVIATLSQGIL
jgi:integrase